MTKAEKAHEMLERAALRVADVGRRASTPRNNELFRKALLDLEARAKIYGDTLVRQWAMHLRDLRRVSR